MRGFCELNVPLHDLSIQSSIKSCDTFGQITMNHINLRIGSIVYVLIFCKLSFSSLLSLNGFRLSILLRDNENALFTPSSPKLSGASGFMIPTSSRNGREEVVGFDTKITK